MNIEFKKLFGELARLFVAAGDAGGKAALLPLLPGQRFNSADIAMNARDLVEKLCFQRFCGVVYFQSDDARGDVSGVALIKDDALIGALFSIGQTQWVGAEAWARMSARKSLMECLVLEADAPFVEAYSALLSQVAPANSSAHAWRLGRATHSLISGRATGAVRVQGDDETLIQFFHRGVSLGLFSVDSGGRLTQCGSDFSSVSSLPRRARLEVWERQEQTLFRSPSPFDAKGTRALAACLNRVLEQGSSAMEPQTARARWIEITATVAQDAIWARGLAAPRYFDLPAPRRVTAFESVLKNTHEDASEVAGVIGTIVDKFLNQAPRGIGA